MCPVSNQPEIPFDTNKKPFHFARWEDKLGEWTTIIAAQTEFTPHEWIYDAGHNRLLAARDPYSLWRWDLDAATPLPDLNTPNHSIESLRIHRNGELAMLLRPWHGGNEWKRLNWTLEATKVHTEALHENGERPSSFGDATSTQPPTIWNSQEGSISLLARLPVAFSGRDNAQFFPSGHDYLSEDRSHLFSIQSQVNFVRHWARENLDGSLPIRYAPQGSFQFPMKYQPRLFALSPSGTKMALSDGATLAWAQIPFAEWKTILWGNAKGESIQSLEWNSNENQLAIGLETGDVLLHEPQTGKNDRLSRSSDGAVHDLLWLPDGLALAAACQDGSICIWDLQQRERRLQIAAHRGAAKSLAFDATKNILYSGGEDGVVRRWKGLASDDASTNTTHVAGSIQKKVQEQRKTSTEATRRNRAVASGSAISAQRRV